MAKTVYFVGDVAQDEYYSTETFPRLAEKVIVHTLPSQMGGMIANAACVYTAYGQPAGFLTALNGGPTSQKLLQGLAAAGLDTRHMVRDDSLPDAKTIIILAEGEHTVFIPTLGIQSIEITPEALEALCRSNFIYSTFCEFAPLRCGGLDAAGILRMAREHGCRFWCDLDVADIGEEDDWFFDHIDTLFLNQKGIEALARGQSEEQAVQALLGRGIGTLVVTKAGQGCEVHTPGQSFRVPGVPVEVRDVTGAGDTFCASFLYAATRSDDLALCAEFANLAAARAVTGMGGRYGAAGAEAVLRFACKKSKYTEKLALFG